MPQWYYIKDGHEHGPVDTMALKRLALKGDLALTDRIWREGLNGWIPAAKVKGLFSKPVHVDEFEEVAITAPLLEATTPIAVSTQQAVPRLPIQPPPIPQRVDSDAIFCEKCGERNMENNLRCTRCGHHLHATPAAQTVVIVDDIATMSMLLPIGRSGWAIASGYLGLFAVLLFPAPFAVLTGILAIFDIRKHPHKLGMGRAVFGIVMGSCCTIGLILMIIAAIF